MKSLMNILLAVLLAAGVAYAQDKKSGKHGAAEIQQDVMDHRAMADAHLAAAKCLEEGKGEKFCHASWLRTARAWVLARCAV